MRPTLDDEFLAVFADDLATTLLANDRHAAIFAGRLDRRRCVANSGTPLALSTR